MYPATSLLAHLNERSTRSSRRQQFSGGSSLPDIVRWYGCGFAVGVDPDIVVHWDKYLQRQQWSTTNLSVKRRPLFLCCSWFKTRKEVRYLSKQFKKVEQVSTQGSSKRQTLHPDDLHIQIDAPLDSDTMDEFGKLLVDTFGTNGYCRLQGVTIEICAQQDRTDLEETVSYLLPVLLAAEKYVPTLSLSCNVPSWETRAGSGISQVLRTLTRVLSDPDCRIADLSLKFYQAVSEKQLDSLWGGLKGHSRMKCFKLELANKPDGEFGGSRLGKAVIQGLLSCNCYDTLEHLTVKSKGLSPIAAYAEQSTGTESGELLLGSLLSKFRVLQSLTLVDRSVSAATRHQFSRPGHQGDRELLDLSSLTNAIMDHESLQCLTLEIQPSVFPPKSLKQLFVCCVDQQRSLEELNIPNLATLTKRSTVEGPSSDDIAGPSTRNHLNNESSDSVRFVCDGSQALRVHKDTALLKEALKTPHPDLTTLDVGHATSGMVSALCAGLHDSRATKLRELSLQCSSLTSEETEMLFRSLLESPLCPNLETLSVDHCGLGVSTLRFLAQILLSKASTSLTFLSLVGNPMLLSSVGNTMMSNEELFFTSVLRRNYALQHVAIDASHSCKREIEFLLNRNQLVKHVLDLSHVNEVLLPRILERVGCNFSDKEDDEGAPGALFFVFTRIHHHTWST